MDIKKEFLLPFLMYSRPIVYNEKITLQPVKMKDYIVFQGLVTSFTVRKNSLFADKNIIKMSYLDFLIFSFGNSTLEIRSQIDGLSQYYFRAIEMIKLCCVDAEIKIDEGTGRFSINDEIITPEIFDDLRKIILIQNDVDFEINEFLNRDTESRLQKAQMDLSKNDNSANIEDYIDSMIVALGFKEEDIMNMSIRKFWRFVKRYQLKESYTILKTGECSGMVSFKEPIKHWVASLDEEDKYKHLKANENELRSKMG